MAGNRLMHTASSPVDAYLDDLSTLLRGPRRRRTRILTELREGLQDAVDDQITNGVPRAAAEKEAIAEFGTPQEVADAFTAELATAYARRTVAAYVATGPLVGIWWLLLLQPHPWRTGLTALLIAIPVLPLVAVAVLTSASALATTGRLIRWLPETSPSRALSAVIAVAGLAVAADTAVMAVYLQSGSRWRLLAIAAVAASTIRIVSSVLTLRRATAMRRTVHKHEALAGGADAHR